MKLIFGYRTFVQTICVICVAVMVIVAFARYANASENGADHNHEHTANIATRTSPEPSYTPAPLHNSNERTQELLDRYAPIIITVNQSEVCDPGGDPFLPMSVEALLGNPEIALRQIGAYDPVRQWGPKAKDIHNISEGFYLDYPGSALQPGCIFEKDYRRWVPERKAIVYGRVVSQAEHPNKLAVQYWLFWYFNDWNNKHESDWEFIQLIFEADSVDAALNTVPTEVGYSQHYGGERSAWDDKKLAKTGTHPHVHVASRSHASFYGPHLYLGRNAKEGFGCDDATGNTTQHLAQVIALPDSEGDTKISANSPFAWVEFRGRWGERLSGPNNAPYGPRPQDRWTNPITWQQDLRDTSLQIPVASTTAETAATFCRVVGFGSTHYIRFLVNPWQYLALGAGTLLLGVWLVSLTDWDQGPLRPLAKERKIGQLYFSAIAAVRHWPKQFSVLLLLSIPLTASAAIFGVIAERNSTEIAQGDTKTSIVTGLAVTANLLISIGGGLLMSATAARMFAHKKYDLLDAKTAIRDTIKESWLLTKVGVAAIGVPILIGSTIIGLPVAVWLYLRWVHTPALSTQHPQKSVKELLAQSSELVKRRVWKTALVYILNLTVIAVLTTAVTLAALLVVPSSPLWLASTFGALVGVSLYPFNSYVNALLWGDALSAINPTDKNTKIG